MQLRDHYYSKVVVQFKLEQGANLLCAEANSAFYSQWDGT